MSRPAQDHFIATHLVAVRDPAENTHWHYHAQAMALRPPLLPDVARRERSLPAPQEFTLTLPFKYHVPLRVIQQMKWLMRQYPKGSRWILGPRPAASSYLILQEPFCCYSTGADSAWRPLEGPELDWDTPADIQELMPWEGTQAGVGQVAGFTTSLGGRVSAVLEFHHSAKPLDFFCSQEHGSHILVFLTFEQLRTDWVSLPSHQR